MSRILKGLAAGAVGTSLLNTVTYADMALRGRPASSVPEDDVETLASNAGVSLDDERKQGLAALLGFVTGFAGGATLGLLRPLSAFAPWHARRRGNRTRGDGRDRRVQHGAGIVGSARVGRRELGIGSDPASRLWLRRAADLRRPGR